MEAKNSGRSKDPDALHELEQLEAKLRDRELLIALLEQQRADMERRLAEIYASKSWRLGAPFRAVSKIGRSVGYFLRKGLERPQKRPAPVPEREAAGFGLAEKNTFAIYRIIGNDLPPRHHSGQSLENLRFILEHEAEFPGCEKVFILNRIVDHTQEAAVAGLLDAAGYRYIRIPFVADEYRQLGLDPELLPRVEGYLRSPAVVRDPGAETRLLMALHRQRISYVMNVNSARNAALEDGRTRARWIFPWDGNCFLARDGWEQIQRDVERQSENRYFLVPMARMRSNDPLVNGDNVPQCVEEPQVIFRADAGEWFNPSIYYGHRDKVELLWRLGAKGAWSSYRDDPWDPPRPAVSTDAGYVGRTGWVARLYSGRGSLEEDAEYAASHRALARSMAVMEMLRRLDQLAGVQLTREHLMVLGQFRQI